LYVLSYQTIIEWFFCISIFGLTPLLLHYTCLRWKSKVFFLSLLTVSENVPSITVFFVQLHLQGQIVLRAPDKLRICVFYAMKTSKNACIIRSECTHYACILLCKQNFPNLERTCTVVYITIHFCLWEIPRNYFPLYFSKERAYTSEGYRNASLSKHRCQKRSDWMLMINHPIAVNNKVNLR
jgi:hypothetical protein